MDAYTRLDDHQDAIVCGMPPKEEVPGLVGCLSGALSCGVGVGIGCWPSRIIVCMSNGAFAGTLAGPAALISLVACSIGFGVRCPNPPCLT